MGNEISIDKGTIVEIDFPFSDDPHRSKKRPGLVLWSDEEQKEFILAFITTKWLEAKEPGDIHINKNDAGFGLTGLVKDSKIKATKLTSLSRNMLRAKYGTLTKDLLHKVDDQLIKIFRLKNKI